MPINPNGIDFKRSPLKMLCHGVDLNHPVNLLPPGKFPFLLNARAYQDGRIESRAGAQNLNQSQLPDLSVHTIYRVNDYVNGIFTRYAGASLNLYSAPTATNIFALLDTGYSGNPLSIVPYRPDQSSVIWTYVADSLKMRKFRSDNTIYQVGVAPPNIPPAAELNQPLYQYASNIFDSNAAWTTQGSASGSATGARLSGVTISVLQYTTGSFGWVGICPTGGTGSSGASSLTPGMRVTNGTETSVVEEVNFIAPVLSATTVAQVQFDVGTTGLCTIVTSQNLAGLRRNAMLFIGSFVVRVISVTNAVDGSSSFRCSSSATLNVGDAVVPPPNGSIWLYTNTTWTVGQTLSCPNFSFTVNPGGAGSGTVAANLSSLINWGTVAVGRQAGPDDYIHFSIFMDHPENLVEGQFVIDVDPGTTSSFAATDGNSNAYYKTFRASDFQNVITGASTTDDARATGIQALLQNETNLILPGTQIPIGAILSGTTSNPADDIGTDLTLLGQNPSVQLAAGFSQYAEIKFKISELSRIGSYNAADLSTIRAFQFRFVVLGNINVNVGDCWLGGSYGPDTSTNLTPFIYRFRYRSSATGAKSRPSPAMRTGLIAQRQAIGLAMTSSTDPQVDKIDIERLGGTAPEWHYIGTCSNSVPAFTDDQYTSAVVVNAGLDVLAFQPFPLLDRPRTSIVNITGTALQWVSGDTFNLKWAEDTEVIVNGRLTTLYASPLSTTLMFTDDSLPSGAGATLEIPEPILAGQPLPVLWGPFYDTLFACGNILDPGSVYFTNEFDPDSASDQNRIEVTSPSETMMNGCMYDSRSYSWSDRRFFSILPVKSETGNLSFQFSEVRNGKGIVNKWAFAVGPRIWYVGADGIYETDGGEPTMITGDLRPLFPQGDQFGEAVNGLNPIDLTRPCKLCYHQSYLFFDYVDTSGSQRTLVYDTLMKGWYPDIYPWGFLSHFSETGLEGGLEVRNLIGGGSNGFVYQHGGFADHGTVIAPQVWTPANDLGDTREKKLFGDIVFDLDPKSTTIFATPSLDNFTADQAQGGFVGTRQITKPIDLGAGLGIFGRNLGVKFTWSSSIDAPALYMWEPSFLERPENTFLRATDWGDGGYPGAKLIRGFLIEADAQDGGGSRSFDLQADNATLQGGYTGAFANQLFLPFALTPPRPATLLRIAPTDVKQWRHFRVSYIFDPLPEFSAIATAYSDEGYKGAKFVQGAIIEAQTITPVPATVQFDGDQIGPGIVLKHPGSVPYDQPYSWVPFIAHNLRVAPSAPVRLGKIRWVFEPAPELAQFWFTQGTSHQIPGWQFLRDGYVACISTANVVLTVTIDGRNYSYNIPSTGGVYVKNYVIFADANIPLKGKLFTYSLFSSSPFRLFVRDSEIRVHPWSGAAYQLRQPFGDTSFQQGAKI